MSSSSSFERRFRVAGGASTASWRGWGPTRERWRHASRRRRRLQLKWRDESDKKRFWDEKRTSKKGEKKDLIFTRRFYSKKEKKRTSKKAAAPSLSLSLSLSFLLPHQNDDDDDDDDTAERMDGTNGHRSTTTTTLSSQYQQLPFTTRSVVTVNVFAFVFNVFLQLFSYSTLCLIPSLMLRNVTGQAYRIFTSAFTHASFFHLLVNMTAFIQIGAFGLEMKLGSVTFALLVFLFTILCGIVHVFLASAMWYLLGISGYINECAVGFSGVIFSLVVLDTAFSNIRQRDVFGLFVVNAYMYPFALIAIVQMLAPNSSFLGHLSGVVVGSLYVKGYLNKMIPSSRLVDRIESVILSGISIERLEGFVRNTSESARRVRREEGDIESGHRFVSPGGTARTTTRKLKWWEVPVIARMESGESQKSSTSTISTPNPTIKGVGRKLGKGKPPSPPPPPFNQQQSSPSLGSTKAFAYNKKFVTLLVEMGFPEEDSKRALENSDNDVARAIDILQGKQ